MAVVLSVPVEPFQSPTAPNHSTLAALIWEPRTTVPDPQKICAGGAMSGPLIVSVKPVVVMQLGPSKRVTTPAGIVTLAVNAGMGNSATSIVPEVPAQVTADASEGV